MSEVNNAAPAAPAAPAAVDSPVDSADEIQALEAAEAEGAPKAEAVAKDKAKIESQKRKFKLKVDGQEFEEELDLSNEEEIKKHLQMSKASQKRMQQFAEYEKGVKGLLETLRTDPLKVLADPRLNIPEAVRQKMAEAIINNEIEELAKTPEQKEKERIQKEYEQLKKQYEEEKKAKEDEKFELMKAQAAQNLDLEISKAIETTGLPKTARTVRYMAEALSFCLENKINISPEDLAPFIKKQTLQEFKEMVSSLPDEEFEDWLGKDQIGRIRKRTLQKLKSSAPNPNQVKATGKSEAKKAEDAQKKIPLKDFMKSLGRG